MNWKFNFDSINLQNGWLSPMSDTDTGVDATRSKFAQSMDWLKKQGKVITLATAIALGAGSMESCQPKDAPTPVETETWVVIDRTTDNLAHKAEFMKNVKITTLSGWLGIINYSPIWDAESNRYKLIFKPSLDSKKWVSKIKSDAELDWLDPNKCKLALQFDDRDKIRTWWIVPYTELLALSNENPMLDLNSSKFEWFVSKVALAKWNPSMWIEKWVTWYLSITWIRPNIKNGSDILWLQIIYDPYRFGVRE